MDKTTNKPLMVEGKEITAETTFTAKEKNGEVTMDFIFNPKGLDGKELVVFEKIYNSKSKLVGIHEDINDKEQTVQVPSLKTKAEYAGTTVSNNNKTVTIKDTVSYTNLIVGKEYTVNGKLMDKTTKKPLTYNGKEITATKTFTPTQKDGRIEVTFNAPVDVVAGKTIVVFEDLNRDGELIVTHYDINDQEQTVSNPKLKTKAELFGAEKNDSNKIITIKDTVSYEKLIKGEKYTVSGILMDKSTNKPFLVEGNEVKGETTFTAENTSGNVIVEFKVPLNAIAGKTLVVFEDLKKDGKLITVHHDINDKEQTVHVPEIGTKAELFGAKKDDTIQTMTIKDTVSYKNLEINKKYTVNGVLMDKSTNKPLMVNGKKVTSTKTFTPKTTNGNIVVEFTVPMEAVKGKTLVVFEDLSKDGKLVGMHHDINDKNQIVDIPKISTTANFEDKSKESLVGEKMTIVDKVTYSNLIVGKEYTVNGYLMDKKTNKPLLINGEKVTSTLTFKAPSKDGFVELKFEVPGKAVANKTLVVFEDLEENGKTIATHHDINDAEQTVKVRTPELPKTGLNNTSLISVLISFISLAGIFGYIVPFKKKYD